MLGGYVLVPAVAAIGAEAIAFTKNPVAYCAINPVSCIAAIDTVAGTAAGVLVTGVMLPHAVPKGLGVFADETKLISHFEKHGAEFGVKNASEYLQVGQDIMQHGQKVEYLYKGETRTGFIQFIGNKANGQSKFGFVGTNTDGAITTIHIESGNSLWKMLNNGKADRVIKTAP